MDYLVGIDLGSTSLKVAVFDTGGHLITSASRPTLRFHPDPAHPEWTVWQPEQVWGGTAEALREAVARLDTPSAIRGVAVTGMGMDGVPIDRDGRWLYPFISWHCPRTQPQYDWWVEHIGAERTFAIGGSVLWRFSTALRLLWMAEHEPGILERTDKWLLIEDFVNFMLCGERATDYTMASCTLLFDQHALNWSDDLLAASGIDRRLLCPPYPSGTPIGRVTRAAAQDTGLPEGTPMVLGGHDYLCGALPVGAIYPGVILDVSGTWEIVLAATNRPLLTPQAQRMGLTVEAHVARELYAAWGGAVSSEMLEWYRREYGLEARQRAEAGGGVDWDYLMADAAAVPPGAHGVTFLPHMSGSGCPVVDNRSLGAFAGLSSFASKGDLARAVVEGLDYQFFDILSTMESVGLRFRKLVVVGGATRNRFWMQNKADVVGQCIEVPEVEDATPLGAAMLAGIGAGIYRDERDALEQVYRLGDVYEPDPKATARYAELFPIYKQLYGALAPVSHQIYDRFLA